MQNKKIMILAIFLVGLLFIGAASAADIAGEDNSTDVISQDFDSTISSTDDLEVGEKDVTSTPKTFKDLDDLINNEYKDNDTIQLSENYTYNSTTDSGYEGGIKINHNVTLYGNGITLDGANSASIFEMSNHHIIFQDIIFVNGERQGSGGAITCNKFSNVINCTFINNHAGEGAAIWFPDEGNVTNCTFINNRAYNGGAICRGGATNCTFIDNYANNFGGALYGGSAINCTFINNNAISGGAIYEGSAINCTFINNHANLGGALYGGSATNPTFILNYEGADNNNYKLTQISGIETSINSAAIVVSDFVSSYNSGEKLLFDVVHDNEILKGVYIDIDIKNETFSTDFSVLSGQSVPIDLAHGVYEATLSNGHPNVQTVTIKIKITEGNTFSDLNKAICNSNSTIITLDRDYTFNSTVDSEFEYGIPIKRELTINGNGHTINATGKARIFKVTSNDVTLNNITFTEGYTTSDGGAIYWSSTNANILNCYFVNNTAKQKGGANFFGNELHDSNINATFTDNTAELGGANCIMGAVNNVNITGNYNNNFASGYGGANFFAYPLTNVNIIGNYNHNKANKGDGGANYFLNALNNVTITGNYNNNTAKEGDGGANYFFNAVSDVNISGTYINNTAESDGGANYFLGTVSDVNISGTYINNTASDSGGANYFNNAVSKVNISGTYINNTAYYGGANRFEGAVSKVNISGTYINNTAESGGANYFNNAVSKVNISGTYINNTAYYVGGANYFFNAVSDVNISGTYINNTASVTGLIYFFCSSNVGLNATISDAIFINNKCTDVIYVRTNGVVAYNNWFGNNATNYNEKPKNHNVNMINWLFLNATADSSRIGVGNSSKIAFVLQSCNETSDVGFYDASKMNVNLTLSQTLGELDKTSALIGEKITYTAKNVGNATVTGKFETVSYTLSLTNTKSPTNITVANSTVDLKVGDVVDSGATLTPADAGNLTYTSSNTSVAIVEKGKIKALTNGTAVITVSFSGNENYTAAENKTINVTVNLKDAIISVNNSTLNLFVDDNFTVVASTNPAGLKVTFVQDDSGVYTVDENGNVTALKEGTGNILVKVGGDGVYAENTTEITVIVSKIPTEITVDITPLDLFVGDEIVIVANLTPAGAGNVTFTSSDYDVVDFDFEGIVIAQGKGQAIITVSFAGDDKYAAAENKTIIINVSLDNASVTVDNNTLDLKVGETSAINATKHPDTIMLDITYTSSNTSVATVDEKGIVTAVGEGTATITIEVGDGEIYAKNSTTVTVTVSKITTKIVSSKVTTVFNNPKNLIVTLRDADGKPISNANITIDLNGAKTYTTDKNGQVKVSTKGLAPETYIAKITFNGNDKYKQSTGDVKVTIKKAASKIAAKAKAFKTTTKTKKYAIILKNNKGKAIKNKKVTLTINKVRYTAVTNSKGVATFNLKKLTKKGTYIGVAAFKGSAYYNKATKKVKIIIKPGFKTISKGSKNKAMVKKIQKALKKNGYYLSYKGHYLKVDGIFHDCTERSVKEFQTDKKLDATGSVDYKTAQKLEII